MKPGKIVPGSVETIQFAPPITEVIAELARISGYAQAQEERTTFLDEDSPWTTVRRAADRALDLLNQPPALIVKGEAA